MSTASAMVPAGTTRLVAILAMVGSAACWGSATVMSREILGYSSAPGLLVVQLAASIAVLSLMALRERPRLHMTRAWRRASLTGLLEPGLAYAVGLAGLSLTTAGHSSVISSAEPIFIILLGWLLFRDKPSVRIMMCIGLAIIGLMLVSGGALAHENARNMIWGDALVVLATMFATGYVVLSARLATDFPPAVLAGGQQTVGFVFAVAVYGGSQFAGVSGSIWTDMSAANLAYAAFSGVVQYAIPFWLYLIGLRVLSAGAAGLYLTLTPVFGIAGAYVWLGEQPSGLMLAGACVIVAAVIAGYREH